MSSRTKKTITTLDASLESVRERPENSFTRQEYMDATGTKRSAAVTRIGLLVKAGKIKPVRIPVKKADGVIQVMPGYQVVDDASASPRK